MVRLFEFRDLDKIMGIWLDEYIAGLFVKEGHQRKGIGHKLIEKNAVAVAFYKSENFCIENCMTEKETGETEYRMVYTG